MQISFDTKKINSTLKETSKDDSDKSNIVYLVNDTHDALNFDEVCAQICSELRLGKETRSCDALYKSSKYYNLIEFKNMKYADVKRITDELHEKAFDSIYLLQIYLNYQGGLDDLAQKTRLIVVYNDAKGAEDKRADIASSKSIDNFTAKLKELSNMKELDRYPKKFKLARLERKLYDKVVTIDVSDFNDVMEVIYSEGQSI